MVINEFLFLLGLFVCPIFAVSCLLFVNGYKFLAFAALIVSLLHTKNSRTISNIPDEDETTT